MVHLAKRSGTSQGFERRHGREIVEDATGIWDDIFGDDEPAPKVSGNTGTGGNAEAGEGAGDGQGTEGEGTAQKKPTVKKRQAFVMDTYSKIRHKIDFEEITEDLLDIATCVEANINPCRVSYARYKSYRTKMKEYELGLRNAKTLAVKQARAEKLSSQETKKRIHAYLEIMLREKFASEPIIETYKKKEGTEKTKQKLDEKIQRFHLPPVGKDLLTGLPVKLRTPAYDLNKNGYFPKKMNEIISLATREITEIARKDENLSPKHMLKLL